MDYTAFGFAGLCLLVCLVCAVIAAHRGGTMKMNLPFVTFDGSGLALTRAVRSMFALIAFVALGCAGAWTIGFTVADGNGSPGAAAAPTVTVTAPADPGSSDGGRQADDGSGDSGSRDQDPPADDNTEAALTEVWSDCALDLYNETVLTVNGDDCPVVTEESGGITVTYAYPDGKLHAQIRTDNDAFISGWPGEEPPTGEQCRDEVQAGGIRGGYMNLDNDSEGDSACIRTSSGDRFLYLRFEEISIADDPYSFRVSSTATAWDVTEP